MIGNIWNLAASPLLLMMAKERVCTTQFIMNAHYYSYSVPLAANDDVVSLVAVVETMIHAQVASISLDPFHSLFMHIQKCVGF